MALFGPFPGTPPGGGHSVTFAPPGASRGIRDPCKFAKIVGTRFCRIYVGLDTRKTPAPQHAAHVRQQDSLNHLLCNINSLIGEQEMYITQVHS